MLPSVGHHRVMEATPLSRGPRDDGFKVVHNLDHSSESPAELKMCRAGEDLSWWSCC